MVDVSDLAHELGHLIDQRRQPLGIQALLPAQAGLAGLDSGAGFFIRQTAFRIDKTGQRMPCRAQVRREAQELPQHNRHRTHKKAGKEGENVAPGHAPTGEQRRRGVKMTKVARQPACGGGMTRHRCALTMSSIFELFSLQGKTAVVIGGTGELCGAIAEGYASAGAEVVLVGRDQSKADKRLETIQAAGGQAYFVSADASRKADLQILLDQVLERSGGCHILINGAGVNSATPFLDIPEEEYDRIMNVNTKGVFLACQVFGKYFVENKIPASIINLGSMSGLLPLSRVFTYSMSKGAVHNLSKNLAREWAPLGIRVNTLVPGFFPAEQNKKVLTPDRVAKIMGHTPMNRFGEAKELVAAALLLAGDGSSFITGHEMVVDGGYSSQTI
jgi:NAD(P)-dependent dehydrogenase (short-subunit alcohol dehydrogenase family)